MTGLLDRIQRARRPPLHALSPAQARRDCEAAAAVLRQPQRTGTASHAATASHKLFGNGFLLDAATIAWMFDPAIKCHHRNEWRFAPLQCDVDGVAPACVSLAECDPLVDPLVDQGLADADRLRAAGVAVTLKLMRGVTHDVIKIGRALNEAPAALDAAAAALQRALQT